VLGRGGGVSFGPTFRRLVDRWRGFEGSAQDDPRLLKGIAVRSPSSGLKALVEVGWK
jgi:hypothetical protein